ncbi:hypothetical protein EIN_018160 [Entamoeba invadens IP1]|uniref:hypothetical protein n=1 Tax=Entamoeba invadens IP1 TaxID=370355 RepID=UPI0002C3D4B2|nr:hypothetical protein EIN_018160 [Entamoeba invadens IP1]ELP90467.1 hypothetical protein EIN_018160 [Entamoeba invadens IP1]|eukprot:XP_004257238.1 hypothetical protein EIN_018160 [Entamoeba invadens IP1]
MTSSEKIPLISPRDVVEKRSVNINTVNIFDKITRFKSNVVKTSKYNAISFFPLVLIEQFRKLANVYFLIISIFQAIPGLSPTGRFTTLFPLCIVLTISMLKELYEDIKRHRDDKKINYKTTKCWKNFEWVDVKWKDIFLGDIIMVRRKEQFPADALLLNSSESNGTAFIETSQLDGETALKIKESLPSTRCYTDEMSTLEIRRVEFEDPNPDLFSFKGQIECDHKHEAVGLSQLLLRGSQLENTDWVTAVVIYIGKETKQLQSAKGVKIKRSSIERNTNYFVIGMFALELTFAMISTILCQTWSRKNNDVWYLENSDKVIPSFITNFITFVILYNNLVPISLYVSMEIVRIFQAYFINIDGDMCFKGKFAEARTSNLNEQLGIVDYIFADKTGTLTQNLMVFKTCFICGKNYGDFEEERRVEGAHGKEKVETKKAKHQKRKSKIDEEIELSGFEVLDLSDDRTYVDFSPEEIVSDSKTSGTVCEFLRCLAICNSVSVTKKNDVLQYQAVSNDEAALVHAAAACGFELFERTTEGVVLNIVENQNEASSPSSENSPTSSDGSPHGEMKNKEKGQIINPLPILTTHKEEFELIAVIPFDSDRKRMSVIVRRNQRVFIYMKGADNVMLPLSDDSKNSEGNKKDQIQNEIDKLGLEGYRTLIIARRDITDIFKQFEDIWEEGVKDINKREECIKRASELVECDVEILGVTGIEDKLQEGVKEAIEKLKQAHIQIWMLTGDKKETAYNIAKGCGLFVGEAVALKAEKLLNLQEEIVEGIKMGQKNYIIEGKIVETFVMIDRSLLKQLLKNAAAIVCCRCAPSQKAKIVELVRQIGGTTLAIGDGANDCAMIREAHVGVGISGEEGLHAVRSSDYAIAQFRFLVKLLLVHGRYNYRRLSYVIIYSFYKNIVMYLTQFWFLSFNGYSGTSLFENWTLSIYNVFFTFFPIVVFGVFDRDVMPETLITQPNLYEGIKRCFSMRRLIYWVIEALVVSALVFFVPFSACVTEDNMVYGKGFSLYGFGYVVYTTVMLTISLKMVVITKEFTVFSHIAYFGSLIFYFLWGMGYGIVAAIPKITLGWNMFGVVYEVFFSSTFYLSICVVPILCVAKDFVTEFVEDVLIDNKTKESQINDVQKRHDKTRYNEVKEIEKELFLPATSKSFKTRTAK